MNIVEWKPNYYRLRYYAIWILKKEVVRYERIVEEIQANASTGFAGSKRGDTLQVNFDI